MDEETGNKNKRNSSSSKILVNEFDNDVPLKFRDPKDYEKMSKEDREKLTKQMLGKLKLEVSTNKAFASFIR